MARRATLAGLASLAWLMVASPVLAADDCGAATRAWAATCAGGAAGSVLASSCPPGHVLLAVASGRGAFIVDATRQGHGLRQVHGIVLSPVGEFADFDQAPPALREGLERVVGCVERDPSLPFDEHPADGAPTQAASFRGPWLAVLGLALVAAALLGCRRPDRRALRILGALLGLCAATFALADGVVGPGFFHQNGQGPSWMAYALGDPSPYGPGFEELFGWVARRHPTRAEGPVLCCAGLLAAACPAWAWIVARRVGAPAGLAWPIALAVALDPILLRVGPSESYYGIFTWAVLGATALVLSTRSSRVWSPRVVLAHVAAGLLLAQAARVHPIGWLAVAAVPLASASRPGSTRRRVVSGLVAASLVGAVIAITSASTLSGVLHGAVGMRWLPRWHAGRSPAVPLLVLCFVAVVLALAGHRRTRAALSLILLALLVAAVSVGRSLLGGQADWIRAAHDRMFLGPALAIGLGLIVPYLRTPPRRRVAAALVLALGATNLVVHRAWILELPADALEQRAAIRWRDRLASGSKVVYVARSGNGVLRLPLYRARPDAPAPDIELPAGGTQPALWSFGDDVYYYRSSLCSTADARGWCDALEAMAPLALVEAATLPARSSTGAVVYDAPVVHVGLYRVLP